MPMYIGARMCQSYVILVIRVLLMCRIRVLPMRPRRADDGGRRFPTDRHRGDRYIDSLIYRYRLLYKMYTNAHV